MKKMQLIFFLIPAYVVVAFAGDVVKGEYTYTFGDNETLVEAKQTCLQLALRDAVERYFTQISSYSEVEAYKLKKDLIRSSSNAYTSNTRILDEKIENRTITYRVSVEIDSVKFAQFMLEESEPDPANVEVDFSQENEDIEIANVIQNGSRLKVVIRYKKQNPMNGRPMKYVHVNFFDGDGNPIGSQRQVYNLHRSPGFVREAGELGTLYFGMPRGAESYRAWLAED